MSLNKKIVNISRELRRNQTEEENKLWQQLRNRKFKNLKFLRQHPIVYDLKENKPQFFIADFYCDEKKLVIEVDGKIHDSQKEYDESRDFILKELGLTTLRIKNEECVDIYNVLKRIAEFLTLPPTPSLQRRERVIEHSEIGGELVDREFKYSISLILLAAGSSSRMGQSKQLLLIGNEYLLLRSVKAALASSFENIIVVLGAQEEKHRSVIDHLPVQVISNPDWAKGMGNSLKAGLNYLLAIQPDVQATVIMVCDQPMLTSSHLDKLISVYKTTKKSIIASHYSNSPGVPALFDKSLFPELLAIADEAGAKKIINKHPDSVVSVNFPEGAVDLDTTEEYENFKNRL